MLGHVEQDRPQAGQVVDVLVAVDERGRSADRLDEGGELGMDLGTHFREREQTEVGLEQDLRQAREARPALRQARAERPALGEVEVQADVHRVGPVPEQRGR